MDRGNKNLHSSRSYTVGNDPNVFSSARNGTTTNSDISKPHAVRGIEETSKYGSRMAERRYGTLEYRHGAPNPPDQHRPQRLGDDNNLQGPYYENKCIQNWRQGFGPGKTESAESKPNFHGYKFKR